jgi:hypothetical protein
MRKLITGIAALALFFAATQSASAATTVGNGCAANSGAPGFTLVSLTGDPTNPMPNAIPSAGVITSWTLDDALATLPPEFRFEQQLKVFRPTGVPKQFQVVGESALGAVNPGINTFPTRIPVHAGDLLAETGLVHTPTETLPFAIFCTGTKPGDLIGAATGSSATGSTTELMLEEPKLALPITVKVEPDADGDGYGDETQDQCPTNASTQGPCPAPPPAVAITLSASAAAKKGLVTVTLTSTAQATVTVGGSVKLGKGKPTKLSGGTQMIAPGTLAKFTVLFPPKLKAALKSTPPGQKLTLSLAASAPGATTKKLTVKVPGQKKPTRKHHHGT